MVLVRCCAGAMKLPSKFYRMSQTHFISLDTAVAMTARFRANRNNVLKPEYHNSDIVANCETFSKSAVETLLQQTGCTGFRIYYGMDEDLKIHAILVGVNSNDADILPLQGGLVAEDPDGTILEEGQRCPPYCPPTSPLNTD